MVLATFGGYAEHVETRQQLRSALEQALVSGRPSLINVVISQQPARKEQTFDWMTARTTRMNY